MFLSNGIPEEMLLKMSPQSNLVASFSVHIHSSCSPVPLSFFPTIRNTVRIKVAHNAHKTGNKTALRSLF